MVRLARSAASDPAFQSFAEQFYSIDQIDAWIRAHYLYRDEESEVVRSPQFMLADMGRKDQGRTVQLEGDCDDVATFTAALAKTLGYPSRIVAIRTDPNDPNYDHVFVEVSDGGAWKTLDATVPPGTEIQSVEDMTQYV